MNKEIALNNLKQLDRIFRENNSEYWLSCGTLLGFYRDGDFIGHDTDTDICLNIDSLNRELITEIINNNFKIEHIFGRYDDGFELTIRKDGVKTDIFLFYKKEKWYHSVYSDFTNVDSLKHDYVFKPFGLKETEFLGHKFITPDDIESVIIQQYGFNWKTPDKNWSWYLSPKNIENLGIRVLKELSILDFNNLIKKNN